MSARSNLVPVSLRGGRRLKTVAISIALASALLAIGVSLRSRPSGWRWGPPTHCGGVGGHPHIVAQAALFGRQMDSDRLSR